MKKTLYQDKEAVAGFAIVPFLILMALCTAVLVGALKLSASSTRTTFASKVRSQRYYQSEAALNQALSWIRANSQNLVTPFKGTNFYNSFDRTSPSIGANDTTTYKVPTRLKVKGTNNSVILTNSSELATGAFPSTSNIVSGVSFDAQNQFAAKPFVNSSVRLTLIDAIPLDPAKDAPPLATPETDFSPIFRLDAMTGTDRGAHVSGYVTGNLYYVDTIGFYGKDYVNVNQDCDSATSTGATPGPKNAKCPVGSRGPINIANNAKVYGSARTNGTVSPANKVCADYPSCTKQGRVCQGSGCAVPDLPVFDSWETYCPTNHGDYTVGANQNRILVTAGCYNTVSIGNRGSLTLQTTSAPYYFKTLTIDGGNPQTQLKIAPSPSSGTIQLYLQTITGNIINGNQTVNPAYTPSQFRIYYLGTNDLKLNGNANMAFAMVAPYANVELLGNGDFYGGIMAKSLIFNGSASITYDETLGGTALNDLTLRLRNTEEGYK